MPKVTIIGVGGFVTHGNVDQPRPVGRGAVLDVDQDTADRLVADGVAREGEHNIDPVLAPAPSTVSTDEDRTDQFDPATAGDDELAAWVEDSTIADIEAAVGDDPAIAQRVLAAEQARGDDQRSTLVQKLEGITA